MKRSIFVSAICALFSMTSIAQTDFSGTWVFKDQQSISGNLYSNGVPKQITITQADKSMIIEKITAVGDGADATATDTLKFDGKPFKSITASKRNKATTLAWDASKNSFITIATAFNPTEKTKADFKTTDTWSIENDQLVMIRKSENFTNGEVWESKGIYEKQ